MKVTQGQRAWVGAGGAAPCSVRGKEHYFPLAQRRGFQKVSLPDGADRHRPASRIGVQLVFHLGVCVTACGLATTAMRPRPTAAGFKPGAGIIFSPTVVTFNAVLHEGARILITELGDSRGFHHCDGRHVSARNQRAAHLRGGPKVRSCACGRSAALYTPPPAARLLDLTNG